MDSRKQLESAIQRLFHDLPCGVVLASTSPRGEILLVNPEFTSITGYTLADIPTVEAWLLRAYPDPAYRAHVLGNWERDVSHPGRDVFYRVRCADGTDKELLLRAGLLEESRMVVALLDASEIRRVQRELVESEERFRLIAETVEHVFWIVGLEPERMEYASPAFEAIWGRPVATLHQDLTVWLATILEEDRPAVAAAWSRILAREVTELHVEYRIRLPDGTVRWIEDSGFAVPDEGGRGRRIVGIAKDITARRHAEEAQRELEQRMLLAQKMESLGLLAGGVAHDFNNLLTGILGHAELALSRLPPDAPARGNLVGIGLAAQRAADLARQMLAYSGRGPLTPAPVDLRALVEEFGSLMEATVTKRARLQFDLADDLPPILADETQIRQVVLNLITNASEALGDRDGVITVSTGVRQCEAVDLQDGPVREERAPGRYCYVEVADDGEGMSEETRARIFEPFFSTKFTGRGLGLAAVLGIVRGHRGSIQLRSMPGQGTSIRVLLPAAEGVAAEPATAQAATAQPGPDRTAAAGGGGATILVVDDEETVRDVAVQMLASGGFRALEAPDGRSALELYRERGAEIDLVLLDQTMPRMGGRETLRALRAIAPSLPVILSSGYDEPQAASPPTAGGPVTFLQKPYPAARLFAAIRDALSGAAG